MKSILTLIVFAILSSHPLVACLSPTFRAACAGIVRAESTVQRSLAREAVAVERGAARLATREAANSAKTAAAVERQTLASREAQTRAADAQKAWQDNLAKQLAQPVKTPPAATAATNPAANTAGLAMQRDQAKRMAGNVTGKAREELGAAIRKADEEILKQSAMAKSAVAKKRWVAKKRREKQLLQARIEAAENPKLPVGRIGGQTKIEGGTYGSLGKPITAQGTLTKPIGSAKAPPKNPHGVINGRVYSGHALDGMQGRGLTPSVVENALSNGTVSLDKEVGRMRHYDRANNVTVITEGRRIVTVIPCALR